MFVFNKLLLRSCGNGAKLTQHKCDIYELWIKGIVFMISVVLLCIILCIHLEEYISKMNLKDYTLYKFNLSHHSTQNDLLYLELFNYIEDQISSNMGENPNISDTRCDEKDEPFIIQKQPTSVKMTKCISLRI